MQYYLYNVSVSELKADPFPVNRLREQLQKEFFQKPPRQDEGKALTNSEAGIILQNRSLHIENKAKEDKTSFSR